MIKKLSKLVIPILFFVIWLILNDNVDTSIVVTGVFASAFCLYIASYLLDFSYTKAFLLPPIKFIKYLFFLLKEIYLNGIKATIMILTGNIKPGIIKSTINPKIENVFLHNILAASITLTPGTITIDNKDGEFIVLSMHMDSNNPLETFEKHLIEIENADKKIK